MITITCPPLKTTSEEYPKIIGMNLGQIYEFLKERLELSEKVTEPPTLRNETDINALGTPLNMSYIPKDGDKIEFWRAMGRSGCGPDCHHKKVSCSLCQAEVVVIYAGRCRACRRLICRQCANNEDLFSNICICKSCFKEIPEFIAYGYLSCLSKTLSCGKEKAKEIMSQLKMRAIVIGHVMGDEEEIYAFRASDDLIGLAEHVKKMFLDRMVIDAIWVDGEPYDYEPVIQVSFKKKEAMRV